MKKISAFMVVAVFAAAIIPFLPKTAQAANPRIEVEALSRSQFRITVNNAPSYSPVDLYYHQSDADFWNAILNIGWTDRNGRFTTTRTFNSFHPELAWFWYAEVDGWSTPSVSTSGRGSSGGGRVFSNQTYANGTLVNDGGTVFIIYRDQKIAFSSARVFRDLNFEWNDVINGNTSSLPWIYTVTNGSKSHPWGSWVKSGNKTYFVHEDGLIPVPSTDILRDNGGRTSWIVPANRDDLRLRKLSNMREDDSRLD